MSDERMLISGKSIPEDRSHTEIDAATGMQRDYVVLSAVERAKGFIKPVRRSYVHHKCGTSTQMARELAETYARDPYFYSGTFCAACREHFPLRQFMWEDGEPMDPVSQEAHSARRKKANREWRARRIKDLHNELSALEAAAASEEQEPE